MNVVHEVSYEIRNSVGDKYTVKLVRDADKFLSEGVRRVLSDNHLALWGIYLFRDRYEQGVTDLKTLLHISSTLRDFVLTNNDSLLYYICDDMMEAPMNDRHTSEGVKVQEYRNDLFSLLFEKTARTTEEDFCDTPIYIDACGNTIYIHVLARKCHQPIVDIIRQDIDEGFAKPE